MKVWKTNVGESGLFISDGNYSSKYPRKEDFIPSGAPFISVINMQDGRITWDGMRYISETQHESLKKGHVRPGDVLLVTRGATIGMTARVTSEFNDANINAQLVLLRADNRTIYPRFLYFLISADNFRDSVKLFASGTAQPQLPVGALKKIPLAFPSFPTQRKIASILSAYDDLIENNTRRIAILEEMAQAIYREWFVNFRFPGFENVKLVDSPLGQIPEGWEVVTLKEMYPTSSGGTPSRKKEEYYNGGKINWVKTKELDDRFIWDTEEKISELGLQKSSAKVYPPHTVIMAMYGATIGQLGILGSEAATNQACCAFRVHDSEYGYPFIFLYCLYNRTDIIGLRAGAAQQNISQDVIREIEIARPPVDLVKQFNDIASPTLQQMFALQKTTANLRTTRDLLLPKLISGKLAVEDLDIDVGRAAEVLEEVAA